LARKSSESFLLSWFCFEVKVSLLSNFEANSLSSLTVSLLPRMDASFGGSSLIWKALWMLTTEFYLLGCIMALLLERDFWESLEGFWEV
jgi:hypothetical protein